MEEGSQTMAQEAEYIVVQAGGKGTRLEHLTKNKPKALVPVENLPMLFHLFRKFPEKKFVIIGDYKKEVLREYLSCFATVQYQMVEAEGTGTCSGVKNALALLPESAPFMLIWSDLILPDSFQLPQDLGQYIGISQSFRCRWSYGQGKFREEPSFDEGVAGLFVFSDKSYLKGVPDTGELVRWISMKNLDFRVLGLSGTREFGIYSEYQALEQEKCRPFNKITEEKGILTKVALDAQGADLAKKEVAWYGFVLEQGLEFIPKIHQLEPLKMDVIKGKNIYECTALSFEEKKSVLEKLVANLQKLHGIGRIPVDSFSMKEAYYDKTMSRLEKIRDLVPFADQKTITVNGHVCRNVFYHKRALEQALEGLSCEEFVFLHGDCTFSNTMLDKGSDPIFIDPRGYFGHTPLYGDPNYDWAKLYYSLVGNYDRFNLKDFSLDLEDNQVKISIISNQWEELEEEFFRLSGTNPQDIKLIHAVIWLSLTTYAWQDYDSICGAFYLGLYYLEEILP